MPEDKKPIPVPLTAAAGEKLARNDDGKLAREIAARVVEEKRLQAIEAVKTAQNANSEQKKQLKVPRPPSRNQLRKEARKLRELAEHDEAQRTELVRLIHEKAEEAKLPFQVLVQRMMDSGKPNLVEMAKIIRRIK